MSFTEEELKYLNYFCSKKLNSIDIGANHGIYLEKLIRLSKKVYGFEPNEELVDELRKRFHNSNVTIFKYGLSNKNGKGTLKIPLYTDGDSVYFIRSMASLNKHFNEIPEGYKNRFVGFRNLNVEVRKLDYFNFKEIGFIKIDVEGHEIEVLEGGIETLLREKPNLLIELEERHRPNTIKRVNQLLTQINYKGFFLVDGSFRPISEFDLEKYQNQPLRDAGYRAIDIPGYINNFIFIDNRSKLL